jgi:hypothetical protein
MPVLLHPAHPEYHGGARLAPPIPPSSGLYVGVEDPFVVIAAAQAAQRNDLRNYVTDAGRVTGQSLAIPIRNQGRYGACTAFAGTAVRAALTARYHLELGEDPDVGDTPSARYAYWRTRQLDGDPNVDQGASMESACRVYPTFGVAPARYDPWDDAKAATGDLTWLNHAPTAEAEAGAQFFGASGFARLSGQGMSLIASIAQCIAEGYPPLIAFGVPLVSFEQIGSDGKVRVPGAGEASLGGHANAVFAVFADNSWPGGGCLLLMNSWSTSWGQGGWGYMPFAWATTQIRAGQGIGTYWLGEAWTVR